MNKVALSLGPHPDDELIGAPAALMMLRDLGWDIVAVPLGFGSPADSERREAEAREAARRARFRFVPPSVPVDLTTAAAGEGYPALRRTVEDAISSFDPAIVVCPSPHDRHPGHEAAARAILAALEARAEGRCWMWSLWGSLPLPTLGIRFDDNRFAEIEHSLEGYHGEIARNDYRRLVRGRSEAQAVLAPELLFGFGSGGVDGFVELMTEAVYLNTDWRLGRARWLTPSSVMAEPTSSVISDWLHEGSITARYGVPGSASD